MSTMTLQDGVVIDARGLAFEMSGSVDDILGYLDDTVRSDLTDTDDSQYLDEAISALRHGDVGLANRHLTPFKVHLFAADE